MSNLSLIGYLAGVLIEASSYRVAFYAMGGAFGLSLIMIFFWMPETAFVRRGAVNLDTGANNVRPYSLTFPKHELTIKTGHD